MQWHGQFLTALTLTLLVVHALNFSGQESSSQATRTTKQVPAGFRTDLLESELRQVVQVRSDVHELPPELLSLKDMTQSSSITSRNDPTLTDLMEAGKLCRLLTTSVKHCQQTCETV